MYLAKSDLRIYGDKFELNCVLLFLLRTLGLNLFDLYMLELNFVKHTVKFIVMLILILVQRTDCFAQSSIKEQLTAGVYIEDIHHIDYSNSTFEIIFYLWVNSNTEFYEIEKYIDINRATEIDYSLAYDDTLKNGLFHSERRISAKIINDFDVNKFPFDNIQLSVLIEFIKNDVKLLSLHLDKESVIKPEYIGSDSLKINSVLRLGQVKYESNYGNEDLGKNVVYPRLEISLDLERAQWNVFLKLFITLFIALFLSASSILLPLKMSEEKFGLIVGSLFTAIGNKYITDDLFPMSGNFNLSDRIHLLTFVFITFMAFLAIIEQRYRIIMSRRMDLILFFGVLCCYLIFAGLATLW